MLYNRIKAQKDTPKASSQCVFIKDHTILDFIMVFTDQRRVDSWLSKRWIVQTPSMSELILEKSELIQ